MGAFENMVKIKARAEILPQAYNRYSKDKFFARNAEFGRENDFPMVPCYS